MINYEGLFKISYGLYIVSSGDKIKGNGFISNTVFQVTAEPIKFAVVCNKNNYTAELIKSYKAFSVSVLSEDTSAQTFATFGYKSGRNEDKMKGMNIMYSDLSVPIILNDSIAYIECKLAETFDVGTHLMFIGDLINAEILDDTKDPITYAYYRKVRKGLAPKNAPTYIDIKKLAKQPQNLTFKKFQCPSCGYIYDEAREEQKFKDLPDDWICPMCGTEKSDFIEIY